MKKYLSLAGLILCAALILGISSGRVYARLTGTEPGTDQWCMGVSGAEVCVDASGNLIPTTDNDTTLGTSALRFATAYIMDITIGDDLTVTDDALVSGDLTVALTSTFTGAVAQSAVGTAVGIRLTTLSASTTGLTVVGVTGQTADLVDISSFTATAPTIRVAAAGQLLILRQTKAQIDALVPVAVGAIIMCTDCAGTYSLCTATGTTAGQWANASLATVGCGTNN